MNQTRHAILLLAPWSRRSGFLTSVAPDYFQGVIGGGAPPFFHGVIGGGAPPFFHGVIGGGAPPFAMITEPSPWVTATVFRLIAPANTSMTRRTTVSLRDIVPPSKKTTPEAC